MKLLLTSGGITNEKLAAALRKLVNGKMKIAFIPTAANVEAGSKEWLIKDLNNFQKIGEVDIVDISALPKSIWLPRLKKATVIAVGGGNTVYLMQCIKKSGFASELKKLLRTRVYVGISAGSIATTPTIQASQDFLYGDEIKKAPHGLGLVNFNLRPHLNSKHFPKVRDRILKKYAKNLTGDTYAIDDESAVLVIKGKISVISEGRWKKYP